MGQGPSISKSSSTDEKQKTPEIFPGAHFCLYDPIALENHPVMRKWLYYK